MELKLPVFLLVLCGVLQLVSGHGRLIKPVGRGTMWRYGYKTPIDYNDHTLYCGGRFKQWGQNHGKCGICGDAYNQPQPRDHEAGGKYGLGIIVERYQQSQIIEAKVTLTANHKGNFEFRICDTNNPKVPATEACLNRNLLQGIDGRTKFLVHPGRDFSFKLKLPPYLTCTHCVFQWKYEAGQNPGNQQEHFVNCADVSISRRNQPYIPPQPPYKPPTQPPYIPPTVKPYVPPYRPYVPPTYRPYIPPTHRPTYRPYVPPTYKPYVPPTIKPTYRPYIPPFRPPTYKPYVPPTKKPYFPFPFPIAKTSPAAPFIPINFNVPVRPVPCPSNCSFLCNISIHFCPAVCLRCYVVSK